MGVDFSSLAQTLIKTVRPNWYKLIPEKARAPGMKKGKVSIGFAIQQDGKLGHVGISRSSGDFELDRAAFDAILNSAPFPPLPLGFTRPSLSFRFHFSYNPGADVCAADDFSPIADNSVSAPTAIRGVEAAGAVFRVGGSVSAPHPVYAPDPEYSEAARTANGGVVVLWLIVGPDGTPRDIKVARSLGMGLDEKASEAVKQWKFEPAMKDGQPVAVHINVEVSFRP